MKYDHKGHIRPHLWNLSGLIYLNISDLITTLKYVFLWTTLVLIYWISNVLSYLITNVLSTRITILHYFNADLTFVVLKNMFILILIKYVNKNGKSCE